jgi:hypothetical protein
MEEYKTFTFEFETNNGGPVEVSLHSRESKATEESVEYVRHECGIEIHHLCGVIHYLPANEIEDGNVAWVISLIVNYDDYEDLLELEKELDFVLRYGKFGSFQAVILKEEVTKRLEQLKGYITRD